MTDLHSLQARAGDLERAIGETDDQHGSLLSGLERGLSTLRERLVEAKVANDRLARENDRLARDNAELQAIAEQLLTGLENKPAASLHDKLAALDGQLHGLLELSGGQTPSNGTPVSGTPANGAPVNGTPAAAGDDGGAPGAGSEAGPESRAPAGGPFEEIRERMRALSSQLLAPAAAPAPPAPAAPAAAEDLAGADQTPASIRLPDSGPPPEPAPERRERRAADSPRAFDRPIRALAEKAQSVLPKARLRFDAETDYALTILRRLKGGRQPFSIEEVRELINGKFGLSLTDRDDAQLSASLANRDGVTRGPRGSRSVPSWRFEMG